MKDRDDLLAAAVFFLFFTVMINWVFYSWLILVLLSVAGIPKGRKTNTY